MKHITSIFRKGDDLMSESTNVKMVIISLSTSVMLTKIKTGKNLKKNLKNGHTETKIKTKTGMKLLFRLFCFCFSFMREFQVDGTENDE